MKKKLYKLLLSILIFKAIYTIQILILALHLKILSFFTDESFNFIYYFSAFYKRFTLTMFDIFTLNIENAIISYMVEPNVITWNPFGLIAFLISFYLTKIIIFEYRVDIIKIKSNILDYLKAR